MIRKIIDVWLASSCLIVTQSALKRIFVCPSLDGLQLTVLHLPIFYTAFINSPVLLLVDCNISQLPVLL